MSEKRVFTKCAWRLIPFMMLLYPVNYIDRLNVGFAALTMNRHLGFFGHDLHEGFGVTARQMRKNLAGCGSAIALAACATPNVGKDYVLSATTGKGVVVGSITSAGVPSDYRLMYRQIGSGARGFFQLKSPDPDLNAALIAAELPAGDYEIYSWIIYLPIPDINVGSWTEVDPLNYFSIPFHVAPGQAVYIASCAFDLSLVWRMRFWDIDAASVVCSDRSKRDINELERLHPGLRNTVIQSRPDDELYRSSGFRSYGGTGPPSDLH